MTTLDDRTTSRADGAEGSGPTLADVSGPSRVAEPDEAISAEELQLAARNHGIPLEALRYDVTPAGPALPAHPLRHPGGRPERPTR